MFTPAYEAKSEAHFKSLIASDSTVRTASVSSDSALAVLQHAVEKMATSVLVFDARGVCRWANPASCAFLGVEDAGSLTGRLNLWRHCLVPGDSEGEAIKRALEGNKVALPEVHYDTRDLSTPGMGNVRAGVSVELVPLLDENGSVNALYVFNRPSREDALETRLLDHSILMAKRLARRAAHDFNNMLAVVQGYAYMLQNRLQDEPENWELAKLIESSGTEALELTSSMAFFANHAPSDMTELDLNQVVGQFLARSQDSLPEGVRVDSKLEQGLPQVVGDEDMMGQLCLHLWENALEAMPEGGLLSVRTESVSGADSARLTGTASALGYVRLRIADTGVGMEEEVRAAMFEPFYTTKAGKDRGMGATLVYDTVKAHGSFIAVDSSPANGTSVDVYLPASPVPAVASSNGRQELSSEQEATLLVVDDEEMIRRMMKEMLAQMGYRIMDAASGEEAVRLYREHHQEISAVLLDITLPGMGGKDTFLSLRGLDSGVKVIICSGDTQQPAVEEMLSLGACAVLPKPFFPEDLSRALSQVLA